jgi:hypothetical protein
MEKVMRYLFVLILFLLSSVCFGEFVINSHVYNCNSFNHDYCYTNYTNYNYYDYYNLLGSNLMDYYPGRYINDLGHVYPFVCGTYWRGGAWGRRNGYNRYYGNVYHFNHHYFYHHYHTPTHQNAIVPEPSSLVILSVFLFFFRKKVLKSDKIPI